MTSSTMTRYLGTSVGMDTAWEESKHHRADNGRFTSGSGRGKKASGNEDTDGTKSEKPGDNGREEMSEERATKIVRRAFKEAKCELVGLKLVSHALNADVKEADDGTLDAINEHLTKHGLKASIKDKTTFKIAEDGYDDIQVVDDPMLEVLVELCAVGLMAKDLHYRAKGLPFYGLHELADLVHDIEGAADDLNEVYYMGEKSDLPPDRAFVASKAAQMVGRAGEQDEILTRLTGLVEDLAKAVENAKKPGVASGTAAVLDDISKKSLQAKGLLVRTIMELEKRQTNSAAIDRVVGKGFYIKPDAVATDSGTSEGAIKAAQTRKANGGGMSNSSHSALTRKLQPKTTMQKMQDQHRMMLGQRVNQATRMYEGARGTPAEGNAHREMMRAKSALNQHIGNC